MGDSMNFNKEQLEAIKVLADATEMRYIEE